MNKINKLICTRVCDFMVTGASKTIIVTVVYRPTGSFAAGAASCAPGDEFDIRVGVPLALKRALSQIKKVNRKAITREFFRQWKEAHPHYQPTTEVPSRHDDRVCQPRLYMGDKIIVDGKVVGIVG